MSCGCVDSTRTALTERDRPHCPRRWSLCISHSCSQNRIPCATMMWWLSAHEKKSPSDDLFGNNVSPKVNQVFTACLNNFPTHVESPVCHAEDGFLTMHVTQRYQGHTMIQPWKTTWAIFFRSRCANRIYILWGDFLVAVHHAVGWLIVLWGTKGQTLVI